MIRSRRPLWSVLLRVGSLGPWQPLGTAEHVPGSRSFRRGWSSGHQPAKSSSLLPSYAAGEVWEAEPLPHQAGKAERAAPSAGAPAATAVVDAAPLFGMHCTSPPAVEDAAVQRLVACSLSVGEQQGRAQQLEPMEIAARVRVLLGAGLEERDVRSVIEAGGGGPHFDVLDAVYTLRLLSGLGIQPLEVASWLRAHPTLLACSPEQAAEVVQLLLSQLCNSAEQVVRVLRRAPTLLTLEPAALETTLAWWRDQARNLRQWWAIRTMLRQFPAVLQLDEGAIRAKLQQVHASLGASREVLAELLAFPAALRVVLGGAVELLSPLDPASKGRAEQVWQELVTLAGLPEAPAQQAPAVGAAAAAAAAGGAGSGAEGPQQAGQLSRDVAWQPASEVGLDAIGSLGSRWLLSHSMEAKYSSLQLGDEAEEEEAEEREAGDGQPGSGLQQSGVAGSAGPGAEVPSEKGL